MPWFYIFTNCKNGKLQGKITKMAQKWRYKKSGGTGTRYQNIQKRHRNFTEHQKDTQKRWLRLPKPLEKFWNARKCKAQLVVLRIYKIHQNKCLLGRGTPRNRTGGTQCHSYRGCKSGRNRAGNKKTYWKIRRATCRGKKQLRKTSWRSRTAGTTYGKIGGIFGRFAVRKWLQIEGLVKKCFIKFYIFTKKQWKTKTNGNGWKTSNPTTSKQKQRRNLWHTWRRWQNFWNSKNRYNRNSKKNSFIFYTLQNDKKRTWIFAELQNIRRTAIKGTARRTFGRQKY